MARSTTSMARSTPAQNERGAASRIWRPSGTAHLPGAVSAEGHDREHLPVQVVVDVEVARKAGPGEPRLVPRAVRALGVHQPGDAALHGPFVTGTGDEGDQGPRRLRRGRLTPSSPRVIAVRAQVLPPAA